jgi:hypothetical protein
MRLTTVVAAGAAAGLAGAEEAQLRTGELSAWPSAPTTGPVAGGDRAGRAARLVEAGSAVLLRPPRLWRQSGLAQRAGTGARRPRGPRFPTEQRPEPIVDYGESLGCAGVAESALGNPPAGLLLRSPFTDLAAAGARLVEVPGTDHNHPILPDGRQVIAAVTSLSRNERCPPGTLDAQGKAGIVRWSFVAGRRSPGRRDGAGGRAFAALALDRFLLTLQLVVPGS